MQDVTNVVASTTPAGGGDISPASAGPATSQVVRSTAGATDVVEPPKPEASPAEAGSDEIRVEELFDLHIQEPDPEDDRDPFAFPRSRRVVCSASSDGQVTIHRRGSTGLALTAEEAHTVFSFLYDSKPIWSRAAA